MTDNRATELLRKLLEERGVKWWETINHANCIFTWWESSTFGMVHAMDNEDGETLYMACLNNCDFTPEQAIAATLGSEREKALGSGTCKPVETETLENVTVHVMECDECGGTYEHVNGDYKRCPHCGRRNDNGASV